jgi:urease accessory protein
MNERMPATLVDQMSPGAPWLLPLLQFADGLFPAGGFAHSFGLEAYVQAGLVRDQGDVEAFLASLLEGAAGPCDAVALCAAARAAVAGDGSECERLDELLDAFKTPSEFRNGGRQMGRQTLRVASAVTGDALLARLTAAVDSGRSPGQHAVAFGCVAGRCGVPLEPAAQAFLYSTAALVVGAALRLLPLGQLDGQRLLWGVRSLIPGLARRAARSGPDDMWSFTPGIEIQGMLHATLPQRLFRS